MQLSPCPGADPAPRSPAVPEASTTTAGTLCRALAAATAALLAPGLAPAQPGAATTPDTTGTNTSANTSTTPARVPWQVDSALLVYAEGDGRVKAIEPVVSLLRTDGNDRSFGLKITVDTLTGASPNGAAPQPGPQTFTSPSGLGRYTTAAGQQPLDPSFKDTRLALGAQHTRPLGANDRITLGGNFSREYDFTSMGASAAWAHDLAGKNTTLSLGLALELNQLRPVGGTPVGLTPVSETAAGRGGDEQRRGAELLLGVTQVINRHWLTQVNLGLGRSTGEHSDPYKLLSVVDGTSGLLTGDRYVHEKRPDSRSRFSLYWQNKVHFERDVLDAAYRYYQDDWGVRAHTFDLRWRWMLGGGRWLEPQWRYHRQGAADFSRGWLVEGRDWSSTTQTSTLAAASADPRLAGFAANTLGLAFGLPLGQGQTLTLRLSQYQQRYDRPEGAPGALQTLELAPALKATMVNAAWSFNW